jgi:uncharacterized lipoprotein YddW (UPF0748 family)
MKIRLLQFLLLAILMLCLPLQAEIRSIWVLPWSTNTPEKIDKFIFDAIAAGQTDVFIEVRYRADALYQTNRRRDDFPNPEPQSYILNGKCFDPLDYMLSEAHRHGLKVHAWFVVFQATALDSLRIAENYLFRRHPDWFTYDDRMQRMRLTDQYGYFIDPGVPEVQEYLLNIIGDLLSGYPELDGLQLDYIRYPDRDLGHHPISEQRYADMNQYGTVSWNEWRMKQVTQFVEKVSSLVNKIAPEIVLSTAVIADFDQAVQDYAQEWQDWLQRGLVDFVYPMAYQKDWANFERVMQRIGEMHQEKRIVVGVRAWNENGHSMLGVEGNHYYCNPDVQQRIDLVRSMGFAGIALFSYDGLAKDSALGQLARLCFQPEVMETLTTPKQEQTKPQNVVSAADIRIQTLHKLYELDLSIPTEGKWVLQVSDLSEHVFLKRNRYYLQGDNQDYWNGELDNGQTITPGDYLVSVYREQDSFEYIIPVNLPELPN